jgi:hypothetical protein
MPTFAYPLPDNIHEARNRAVKTKFKTFYNEADKQEWVTFVFSIPCYGNAEGYYAEVYTATDDRQAKLMFTGPLRGNANASVKDGQQFIEDREGKLAFNYDALYRQEVEGIDGDAYLVEVEKDGKHEGDWLFRYIISYRDPAKSKEFTEVCRLGRFASQKSATEAGHNEVDSFLNYRREEASLRWWREENPSDVAELDEIAEEQREREYDGETLSHVIDALQHAANEVQEAASRAFVADDYDQNFVLELRSLRRSILGTIDLARNIAETHKSRFINDLPF